MRTSDSPFVTDWFAVSLRWLVLLGAVLSMALAGKILVVSNVLFFILVFWNLTLTLLAGLNVRMKYHRQVSLAMDLLIAAVYFIITGGFANSLWWFGILPVFTAAIYFEWRGILITVPLMIVVQVAFTANQSNAFSSLVFPIGSASLLVLLGILFGFLSTRLVQTLRRIRQVQLDAQREKLRIENERMRAIYNLTSTLTSTLNYQRVLDSVLDLSLSAVNTDPDSAAEDRLVAVVMLYSKNDVLEVASARRLTPADKRATLLGQSGAVGRSLEKDKPVLVRDIKSDPELSRIVTFMVCREIYCFPLRSGFSAYGVLLFGHPEIGYFTPDRRETIDILGSQAVIAIQNARLYQDLVDERDRMIDVQEETRKKLARDLHDGPTQSVAAIAMRINLVHRMMTKTPEHAALELEKIEELARRTSKEIRHMLFTLRPLVLESQGLVAALQSIAETTHETYLHHIQVQVDESILKNMEIGKQSVIFYIVEEAITNARKHAKAANIWIRFNPYGEEIALLEIQDDGIGFDVASVTRAYDQRGSLGMVNLRERAELVNGVLNLQSEPGKGTRVQVYIPLTEEAGDRLHHPAKK
jgi:signal transduction histidine kinase